jgi:transcriptional regulator with XRE-family HTH domain
MSLNEEVGQRIKRKRREKNITQQSLADSLGVSKSYVSRLETGQKKISLDRIETISIKLNVKTRELLIDD